VTGQPLTAYPELFCIIVEVASRDIARWENQERMVPATSVDVSAGAMKGTTAGVPGRWRSRHAAESRAHNVAVYRIVPAKGPAIHFDDGVPGSQ